MFLYERHDFTVGEEDRNVYMEGESDIINTDAIQAKSKKESLIRALNREWNCVRRLDIAPFLINLISFHLTDLV